MPTDDDEALERAHEDAEEGKAPSTQAGEFVREEIEHVREGKHGARSAKQAIAIGLSKARRAGIKLKAPSASTTSPETRRRAQLDSEKAGRKSKPSPKRSRAVKGALKREGKAAGSRQALSRQARAAAKRRTGKQRSQAAQKAARTRASTRRKRRG
jgi:Family of unknown function (DUF6496)